MQLPDNKFIACSYQDYLLASSNEIPERWLRAQERGWSRVALMVAVRSTEWSHAHGRICNHGKIALTRNDKITVASFCWPLLLAGLYVRHICPERAGMPVRSKGPRRHSCEDSLLTRPELVAGQVGICVYDPAKATYIYNYQGDKYFIPASNTKLFTLYAGLKYLGDSLVGCVIV